MVCEPGHLKVERPKFLRGPAQKANNTVYESVCHRLRVLFYQYDVDTSEVEWLTCDWFRASARVDLTDKFGQQKLARERMDGVWAAWHVCLSANGALRQAGYLQEVGYFMDAHVALATSKLPMMTYGDVVRRKLSPNQCEIQIGITEELTTVVKELWMGAPCTLAISKLLSKGFPQPKSVRYIRPQLMRCAACAMSKRLATELITNWMLGRYAHRKIIAPPGQRLVIMAMNFEELCEEIHTLPSRSLYYVIAECLAGVTAASTEIYIRAVGVVSRFSFFFNRVATAAEAALVKPNARLQQCVNVGGVQPIEPAKPVIFQQWLCNTSTTLKQKASVRAHLGIDGFGKFYCPQCKVLHVKLGPQPRAAKSRLGVSIDLDDPFSATAVCNACGGETHYLELLGRVTKAKVGKKVETLTVCSFCGILTHDIHMHGQDLCCPRCASAKAGKLLADALPCPCGWDNRRFGNRATDSVHCSYLTVLQEDGTSVLAQACPAHNELSKGARLTMAEWQATVNGAGR